MHSRALHAEHSWGSVVCSFQIAALLVNDVFSKVGGSVSMKRVTEINNFVCRCYDFVPKAEENRNQCKVGGTLYLYLVGHV